MKQKEKGVAAAKADMSEKTSRKYLKAEVLPSEMKKERHWRTREDPFKDAWPEIKQLLRVDVSLLAKTIFDYLCRKSPERTAKGSFEFCNEKSSN